jgi:O-antigen/teichoic acid export membrane protein
MIKPVYIVTMPLVALMLASLSRAADQPETRKQLVVAYYRLLAGLLMPAAAGLAVVGAEVMQMLGGTAWIDAGPLLSVLAIGMFGQATILVGVPILAAADRGGRLLSAAIAVAVVLCSAYPIGWSFGRMFNAPSLGVAGGYALAVLFVVAAPYTWFCLRTAGYPVRDVFAALGRPAPAALIMALVVWLAGSWLSVRSPVLRLTILVPLGAIAYGVLARSEVEWMIGQSRKFLAQPFAAKSSA